MKLVHGKFPKEQRIENFISDDLRAVLAEQGCWIAGGAITSIFTKAPVNDLDIYFPNKSSFTKVMLAIIDGDLSFSDAHVVHMTNKSILLKSQNQDTQFIVFRFFESVEDIFKTFDFTAVMGAYSFKDQEFIFHEDFFRHNAQRFLSFNEGTAYPMISMLRVDKYRQRGYTTSKQEMLKIGFAIAQKNYDSWDAVKEEVGSMYGIAEDNIFDTSKPFSLQEVISQINVLHIPEKYSNLTYTMNLGELSKKMPDKLDMELVKQFNEEAKNRYSWRL